MLVLTREIGETFSIGDDITVQILGINGNQVRLGINAPKDIKVHRAGVSVFLCSGWLGPAVRQALV
ncbi:carbon storage regulator CsrA, partial [Pseudomonas savastanoi]